MHHDAPRADALKQVLASFSDPQHVARYVDGPPRVVPGFTDLHRMTRILIAERAPKDARVLEAQAAVSS